LVAYHTREALVLEANFLRDDLPFFTELLSEVISQTKFTRKLSLQISLEQN
jgi:ubiquinol-cytochrome c reductase core subunit 2